MNNMMSPEFRIREVAERIRAVRESVGKILRLKIII